MVVMAIDVGKFLSTCVLYQLVSVNKLELLLSYRWFRENVCLRSFAICHCVSGGRSGVSRLGFLRGGQKHDLKIH